jgi:light-harvesting protein B-800-850 alpha chain
MNQGRIWCVVNPTVGLPLFLGSVALISFTVHYAVLDNTTWVKDFFAGSSRTHVALKDSVSTAALAQSQAPPAG